MSKILLPVACSVLIAAAAIAQTRTVEITDAWARATPGTATNGAAYLTIESPTADRLTGVSTPVAKQAELHRMTLADGIMTMRPLAAIDLPAGQPVTLKPGALHIMLVGLSAPLRAGQTFPLMLRLENGGTREITVAVEKPGAMRPEGHTGAGMHMPTQKHH